MPATIILVHGAFAGSASWDRVIDPLLRADHHVIAAANPLRGLAADAHAVSDLLRSVEGPVLLVGHSYGGAVITEAGNDPKVKTLVYIAATSCFRASGRQVTLASENATIAPWERSTPVS